MGQTISLTAPRNQLSCPGPNNLPPLQFHAVHGDNIRISRDGFTARRAESFCKGIAFSARPLRVNERVCIKFTEISNNWSGVIRFGFTSVDPSTLRYGLPKYVCPDLTNKPGFWAKALHERYCIRNNVLFYYVTSSGDVHFGINGEEKGVFMTDVDARAPLWAVIDVYGNSTVIELLDSRIYAFHQQHQLQQQQNLHHHARRSIDATPTDPTGTHIIPALEALSLTEPAIQVPQLRYTPVQHTVPVTFHCTKGRNIKFRGDRHVAIRNEAEFCQGYVFTSRPIRIGEKFIVQILKTEDMYVGSLALGLTSCDPTTLQSQRDLPDDSDLLLDRPEYWVVSKDVADLTRYDEIKFCVTQNGELQISKNGAPPRVVMHVDQSLQLWAFLDVYGSTQSVSMYSEMMPSVSSSLPIRQCMSPDATHIPTPTLPHAASMMAASPVAANCANTRIALSNAPSTDMIQLQTGGTVLVVNLPPSHDPAARRASQRITTTIPQHQSSDSLATMAAHSQYIEPLSSASNNAANYATLHNKSYDNGTECIICYTKNIDCVLYSCGHMSLCYQCGIKQWRNGTGQCPLCRAVIKDVIRTYKT